MFIWRRMINANRHHSIGCDRNIIAICFSAKNDFDKLRISHWIRPKKKIKWISMNRNKFSNCKKKFIVTRRNEVNCKSKLLLHSMNVNGEQTKNVCNKEKSFRMFSNVSVWLKLKKKSRSLWIHVRYGHSNNERFFSYWWTLLIFHKFLYVKENAEQWFQGLFKCITMH